MEKPDSTAKYWSPIKKRKRTRERNLRTPKLSRNDVDYSDLIDKVELARLLHRTPKTIQNWVTTQDLPTVRIGYKYMFLLSVVIEWAHDKVFISKDEFESLKQGRKDF